MMHNIGPLQGGPIVGLYYIDSPTKSSKPKHSEVLTKYRLGPGTRYRSYGTIWAEIALSESTIPYFWKVRTGVEIVLSESTQYIKKLRVQSWKAKKYLLAVDL